MKPSRRRAALQSAAGSVARSYLHFCETLERRVLLDANDPVLILVEPIQHYADILTIDAVAPYLWHSPVETLFDPRLFQQNPPPWDGVDRDGNGYPDDAYGWNFSQNSPNFALGAGSDGHGTIVTYSALNVLNAAGSQASRVKIMYVIGGGLTYGSNGLNYILNQKAAGANIVAIGTLPAVADRAGAQALADAGIMLIGGQSNGDTDYDTFAGSTSNSFFSATPRSGVQGPALDNVIPVTTDPSTGPFYGTAYGINSFYGGVAGYGQQSFAGPAAAAMAAVAVQAYQDAHSGQSPTIQQIKRAMMSGVDYVSGLNSKTVTHDYVNGARQDGGFFNTSKIIAAINQTTPEVTGVSMTQVSVDPLGTDVGFVLDSLGGTVSNWTISWGDNSGSGGSAVEVVPGNVDQAQHRYPFENVPHHYFPTIYAMSGTKQVYLPAPSAQAEVVNTRWAPTSGQDNYTLARSGGNVTLTLQNSNGTTSATFAPGGVPTCLMTLGQGADTLTIDFTNGNPLESMALTVNGLSGAGDAVRVIGSSAADTISVSGSTVTVNGSQLLTDANVAVYVNGAAGDDVLTVTGNPRVHLDVSDTFAQISVGSGGVATVDQSGSLLVQVQTLSLTSGGRLDLNDNDMIVRSGAAGGTAMSAIEGYVRDGRNNGAWNGSGIISTAALNQSSHATGIGVLSGSEFAGIFGHTDYLFDSASFADTDTLVKYTWNGDANFSGTVTFDDYVRIDIGFNAHLTGWSNGDFNYDGVVNFDDYVLIDIAFNQQNGTL